MAKSSLRLSQNQKLALTPAMRQSLAVLRLSSEALSDLLAHEAAENPFIEVVGPRPLPDGFDPLASIAEGEGSLYASIAAQIGMMALRHEVAAAALFLASELREDGYLDQTLDGLAADMGAPMSILEEGLSALQSCEPAGVGARTLAECLALQLQDTGVPSEVARVCIGRIEDFVAGRWISLVRATGLAEPELRRIGTVISRLSAKPAVPAREPAQVRIPDLIVDRATGGGLSVRLNAEALPSFRLMLTEEGQATNEAMRTLADRAQALSDALISRRETLLRIGRHIVGAHPEFFRGDQNRLAPMLQRDAAAHLSLHPSTLSRAVRDKSLMAGGRVYPLTLFFQRALPGPDRALSGFDIQLRIRTLIADEDPRDPLADEAITAHLRNEGVDIARRTVAKYRKWMRIPASFARRRRRVPPPPQA